MHPLHEVHGKPLTAPGRGIHSHRHSPLSPAVPSNIPPPPWRPHPHSGPRSEAHSPPELPEPKKKKKKKGEGRGLGEGGLLPRLEPLSPGRWLPPGVCTGKGSSIHGLIPAQARETKINLWHSPRTTTTPLSESRLPCTTWHASPCPLRELPATKPHHSRLM